MSTRTGSSAPPRSDGDFADSLRRAARARTITKGNGFRLKEVDPDDTCGLKCTKQDVDAMLPGVVARISTEQEKLYAQDRWGVLLIFQAMDAAGKDSAIKHVFSGLNPQGVQVFSFKAPSDEELDHDFLWRTTVRLPERGRIGVFNRSYYEEVLVVRVHPEILERQKLPSSLVTKDIWRERYDSINGFERHLARSGFAIRKFFLHVSKKEQRERFLQRLDEPQKRWKFSMADVKERERWGDYMRAYEDTIRHTSSEEAPWVVVPGDKKWVARSIIAGAILDALKDLDLAFPKVPKAKQQELDRVRDALQRS
jgi:PPK2 family polyphosphate:nucleotide phosphotransferase